MGKGYVCPSITATTLREGLILRDIASRDGLRLERRGRGLLLSGPGLYVLVDRVGSISYFDTLPAAPQPGEE